MAHSIDTGATPGGEVQKPDSVSSCGGVRIASHWAAPAPIRDLLRHRGFLLFCLLAELVLILGFYLNRGWTARSTPPVIADSAGAPTLKNDPPLNQPAPAVRVLNAEGAEVNLASDHRLQVIAFLSSCNDCSLDALRKLARFQADHESIAVRVVFASPISEVADFLRQHRLELDFYAEGPGAGLRPYNLLWRPRVFLIDAAGTLRYVQPGSKAFQAVFVDLHRFLPSGEPGDRTL